MANAGTAQPTCQPIKVPLPQKPRQRRHARELGDLVDYPRGQGHLRKQTSEVVDDDAHILRAPAHPEATQEAFG